MTGLILHQYPVSPFSEKVRLVLGYKGLAYHSVTIPMVMPKPDLTALTGGYRRTPVLQIGAHIYCDTRLICRILERLHPDPTIFPVGQAAAAEALGQWADQHLFRLVVALLFTPQGLQGLAERLPKHQLDALIADRMAMRTESSARLTPPEVARSHLGVYLEQLEGQLGGGPDFVLGAAPCIADFSLYHSLWFVRRNPGLSPMLEPCRKLHAWMQRIEAVGHGEPRELTSGEAIEIARDAKPGRPEDARIAVEGLREGARAEVVETDLGINPVEGTLVKAAGDEIAILREDERAGEVMVHFPNVGYALKGLE